ncbi:hypothetical protein K438DRAFT_1781543 [Mycena galopus ATCC 62051]|nr:hypothetical protein K438DRAFT_1781543 [Mycena galopus ATCC 62051]
MLDSKLKGAEHIRAQAGSAAQALNASLVLTHAMWGLKPLMVRDLVQSLVLPRADYGVASFFLLPVSPLKPLDRVNKSAVQCITGSYRTASLAALQKEAALLPAALHLELGLQNRLARYLKLPHSHGPTPMLRDAIENTPRSPTYASPLHYLERLPAVRWPSGVPPRGLRIRDRKKLPGSGNPPEVPGATCAGQSGSGAHNKRGGAVNEPSARSLSPALGDRHVNLIAPPVTSTIGLSQPQPVVPALPSIGLLGMEPILPVYAPPWADPLPVTTIILDKDEAIDTFSNLLADTEFAGSTWAGGAAIRLEQREQREEILIPLGDGQVMEGEVEGLLWATERALVTRHCLVLVVSHSQAGLKGILSTAPRSRQFRMIQYDTLLRHARLEAPHLRVTNLWTPAHIGTVGNELAHTAAKAATLLPAALSCPVSLTTCRRSIREDIVKRWRV